MPKARALNDRRPVSWRDVVDDGAAEPLEDPEEAAENDYADFSFRFLLDGWAAPHDWVVDYFAHWRSLLERDLERARHCARARDELKAAVSLAPTLSENQTVRERLERALREIPIPTRLAIRGTGVRDEMHLAIVREPLLSGQITTEHDWVRMVERHLDDWDIATIVYSQEIRRDRRAGAKTQQDIRRHWINEAGKLRARAHASQSPRKSLKRQARQSP